MREQDIDRNRNKQERTIRQHADNCEYLETASRAKVVFVCAAILVYNCVTLYFCITINIVNFYWMLINGVVNVLLVLYGKKQLPTTLVGYTQRENHCRRQSANMMIWVVTCLINIIIFGIIVYIGYIADAICILGYLFAEIVSFDKACRFKRMADESDSLLKEHLRKTIEIEDRKREEDVRLSQRMEALRTEQKMSDNGITPNALEKALSDKLKAMREARGISQEELSQRCGLPLSTIKDVESGVEFISKDIYDTIAKALG